MNDIILSALVNLFALFGEAVKIESNKARQSLKDYLSRHFGVRDSSIYINLYTNLRELYDLSDIDKNQVIEGICEGIQTKIGEEEQALLLLRLIEFCNIEGDSEKILSQMELFGKIAQLFKVEDGLLKDFVYFVTEQPTDKVAILEDIRVLKIVKFNKIVFTYTGEGDLLLNDIPVLPKVFMVLERSAILKKSNSNPIYYSQVLKAFDADANQMSEIELCGNNIEFRFPNSNNGMHNFTFSLKSGTLVAIMGGSGVGKSTLLSLLNGNLKPQSGSITLNGYNIVDEKVKNLIGYVPQDDLLVEELTVYQNLWFTAKLCFDKLSDEKINQRVDKTLYDLGLDAAKHLVVGSAINKFISGGQRKRLNIALELIREPAVLYLDEPTSGLSSTDSERVINLLREQTYMGRLIVVNIHQPSSNIYKLFDRLWLLDKGGYPVYDGNPIEAVTYFKHLVDYADADISTCAECGNINPEVVLNIIDEKSLNDSGEVTDKRKVTPEKWHEFYVDQRKKFIDKEAGNILDVPETKQSRPSRFKQFKIFLARNFKTKITNTQYLLISMLQAPLLAVIVAMLTRFAAEDGYTIMDNKNLISYFFMAVIVAIFIGMSGSAEEIFKDRAILKRERFLRLSSSSYIWSKILFMAGVSLIQTFLFVLVGNAIMGISSLFGVWWLILFVSAFLANLTGLILSQSLNSIVAIYITIPLLLIPQILLCGLVVKFEDLNPNSTSGNVPIIGEIIPSRWGFEALAVTSFANNDFQKQFFESEKNKFAAQYYRHGFQYELESQLETAEKERVNNETIKERHFRVLRNELPKLAAICEIDPVFSSEEMRKLTATNYSEKTYDTLINYFEKSGDVLDKRIRLHTNRLNKETRLFVKEYSKDTYLDLKKKNYNLNLERFVVNSGSERFYKIVDDRIVPRVAYIYLTPESQIGRAPFFSSHKVLFGYQVHTLWYNMGVLVLMSIIAIIALIYDIPGRYMRNESE